METLAEDTITPIEWLTEDDVQKFNIEIAMWHTYSTHADDTDDTN